MRRRILTLFLSLTSLVGCQHSNGTANFPYTDDKDNAYMTRNGDSYGKADLAIPTNLSAGLSPASVWKMD
jgi:hypothetical protein